MVGNPRLKMALCFVSERASHVIRMYNFHLLQAQRIEKATSRISDALSTGQKQGQHVHQNVRLGRFFNGFYEYEIAIKAVPPMPA